MEKLRQLGEGGENFESRLIMGRQIIDTEPEIELKLEFCERYELPEDARDAVQDALKVALDTIMPMFRAAKERCPL